MISQDYRIKDIAHHAKLSNTTVSRILSGKEGHRPETVRRVRRIAERLQAQADAREFGNPKCVGILLFNYYDVLNHDYNATLFSSIVEALTAENCTPHLVVFGEKNLDIAYLRHMVVRYDIQGLIVPEFVRLYAISGELNQLGIPIVKIGNLDAIAPGEHCVYADNYAGGVDAANYLWSFGHRRFGVVSMSRCDVCQNDRVRGILDAVRTLGGDPDAVWIKEFPHAVDMVAPVIAEARNLGPARPTALVCTNSLFARKLVVELHGSGLSVPSAMSVVAFEDNRELETVYPPVTAIRQPTRAMGELAVKGLHAVMNGRGFDSVPHAPLKCSLAVRNSVAPAP